MYNSFAIKKVYIIVYDDLIDALRLILKRYQIE